MALVMRKNKIKDEVISFQSQLPNEIERIGTMLGDLDQQIGQ